MCRASRRLISSTSAARVVVLPEPVGPPIRTRPRGSCASSSTVCGRLRVASRGTRVGSSRTAAAALPRSRCRLMRNLPTSAIRNDASAIRDSRYTRRACGDSAGMTASSISAPSSGPSPSATTLPSTRTAGGAPATSNRSDPFRDASSRSHRSSRDASVPAVAAVLWAVVELSSRMRRSMSSSGSLVTAADAPGSCGSSAIGGRLRAGPRNPRARLA